mgnify:CR=1 FL=1
MQCKRCRTFFNYDKYYGICPRCACFNRPPGMEEVDLFEDDKRFRMEDYELPQMEGIHRELHKQYDSNKKPHKKNKNGKKIMQSRWKTILKQEQRKMQRSKKMRQTAEYV